MKRSVIAAACAALLVSAGGCLKTASWMANDRGGYTLMTRVQDIDQAVTRFRRTAQTLCGPTPYRLGEPIVVAEQVDTGPFGGHVHSDLTLRSELTCAGGH